MAVPKKNNDSSSAAAGDSSNEKAEDSLSSEDLAKMQKQDMTFEYALDGDDSSEGNSDVPVNKGVTSQNNGSSGEDSYVVVTDDSGQPVKDDNGNVVTEVVKGGNSSKNESSTSGGNTSGGSSYQSNIKTFQAYWLDMSNGEDVVCNGDFLDVTFKIKDDARTATMQSQVVQMISQTGTLKVYRSHL